MKSRNNNNSVFGFGARNNENQLTFRIAAFSKDGVVSMTLKVDKESCEIIKQRKGNANSAKFSDVHTELFIIHYHYRNFKAL